MVWKIPIRVAALRPETGWTRHERSCRAQCHDVHRSKHCSEQRPHSAAESDHAA
jgi:hypothetical protein